MKGKNTFTVDEINALKQLIALRVKADRSKQKRIRDAMRSIGFYGGDDFGIRDCQVSDLERLIRNGEIKVVGGTSSTKTAEKEHPRSTHQRTLAAVQPPVTTPMDSKEAEQKLINGKFIGVNKINDFTVPDVPGLYCIKLRNRGAVPAKFGKVREDGIIYIGQASTSLRQRFWGQELNHHGAATFFRSIGAILGFLPPKGSLAGKSTRNYKFSPEDTESIRNWMRKYLIVNWIPFGTDNMDVLEESLICKYRPLVNIKHNPSASSELEAARKTCIEYAKSQ